jgi:hypothetical protein
VHWRLRFSEPETSTPCDIRAKTMLSAAGDSGFESMVDGCNGPGEAGDGGADPAATALTGTGGSPAIGPDAAARVGQARQMTRRDSESDSRDS